MNDSKRSRMRGRFGKGLKAALAVCLLVPAFSFARTNDAGATSSEEDLEVLFGQGVAIGNQTYPAGNAFTNFRAEVSGFEQTLDEEHSFFDWEKGDIFLGKGDDDNDAHVEFSFDMRSSEVDPKLKALAESGDAEMSIGWDHLPHYSGFGWYNNSWASIYINDQLVKSVITDGGDVGPWSTSVPLTPTTRIYIKISGSGTDEDNFTGARGFFIKFEDQNRPKLEDYTFTGNGAERDNTTINQRELYVKQDENITLTYNFSEPVKPYGVNSGNASSFLRHPLFVNPDGTGLPAAGQQQYLTNQTYDENNLTAYHDKLTYKYTGSKYHHSGNLPLKPRITGSYPDDGPMDKSLQEKIDSAIFVDAAGNVAETVLPGKASDDSNDHVAGESVNPFDFENGGFRVIVDAVAPKYHKSANGIQPVIVTGSVLNDKDTLAFDVQFTEEAVIREGWDVNKTYLHFDNDMKAYYRSGSGTSTWRFSMDISDSVDEETPLLKVLALTNDDKAGKTDKDVVSDYAGNLLIQPANFQGVHTDGDESNVNSKIDWATLSIDNTEPILSFINEAGGATAEVYQRNGKVTIDANDPPLGVNDLDPIVAERGTVKPGKGIYRPSNMTGSSAPAVGLVYYVWTQSPTDPFADKNADHYAAVKRYSLAAKQPRDGLYPGEFADLNLAVANNKTNLLPPPAAALTDEGSGNWYLHAWTADMTWDSARELMQYDKMKNYITDHADQYALWIAQATGSDADKKRAADNKALEAVGQYGDTAVWPLTDFKYDDSNWVYNVTNVKYDNRPPTIAIGAVSGNDSPNVQLPVTVSDEHSGVNTVHYQWVASGKQPKEIDWKSVTLSSGSFTAQTQNEVDEDGDYKLYVKSVDKAGNTRTIGATDAITVNAEDGAQGTFDQAGDPAYVKSHDVVFRIANATPAVDAGSGKSYIEYAFATSAVRPTTNAAYTKVLQTDEGGQPGYKIPANTARNGTQYIHVRVKEEGSSRIFYYYQTYYFDNQPPKVTFSIHAIGYPLPSHEVTVTVEELYSSDDLNVKHQWVRDGDAVPDASSGGWVALPANGVTAIDDTGLEPGNSRDYKLYVWAVDGAGNSVVTHTTGLFKVAKPVDADTEAAPLSSDLVYFFGDQEDGFTAIVKLALQTENIEGYTYSISPDNGESWVKWQPFTNFVAVKVPVARPEDVRIQFKVRTPGGDIGDPLSLQAGPTPPDAPVYALASLSSTRPISPSTGVQIDVAPPPGIRVQPAAANPSAPARIGNSNAFKVTANGYYTFDLTDLTDPTRKEKLIIVVANIDGTAPEATIEYLTASTTAGVSGNITAKLRPSEPVAVTNNGGNHTYTFTDNGSFTFQFRDEAGNIGTATATVANIDKTGPNVRIVRSYSYGTGGSETFGTIEAGGDVLLSSGVTLSLEAVGAEDGGFKLIQGENPVSLVRNGAVSFTVADAAGNTTVVQETVDNIVSAAPQPNVAYTFVDEAGDPLDPAEIVMIGGKPHARGKVKVTFTGVVASPNAVFAGVVPIGDPGAYTNQVSEADGAYTHTRIFSANGTTTVGLSDLLGNVNKVPVKVEGLDNTPPEIALHKTSAGVARNKANFNFAVDLGGYTVTDNVSAAADITVTVSVLDLATLGRQTVTYTVKDQVGNTATATQSVYVLPADGMLIFGDDTVISGSLGETALFNDNVIKFTVTGFNTVKVNGQERINERGTFDILVQSGLYREGQMKYIARKISYKELVNGQFTVTFPQAGWYTIIIRNQEREREFATFFVGGVE